MKKLQPYNRLTSNFFSSILTQSYMGHTSYSTTENVNNIKIVHLHWGPQLIFDESQKEGNNEIRIDIYPLTRFLAKPTQAAVKVAGTKGWAADKKTDCTPRKIVHSSAHSSSACWVIVTGPIRPAGANARYWEKKSRSR